MENPNYVSESNRELETIFDINGNPIPVKAINYSLEESSEKKNDDEIEHEDLYSEENSFGLFIIKTRTSLYEFLSKKLNFSKGLALFLLTIVVVLFAVWEISKKKLNQKINFKSKIITSPSLASISPWIIIGLVTILCISYLIYDLKDYRNLISLLGLSVFIMICIFISEHPSRINLRALVVGILIQYILGVFILRLEFGYRMFQFLGKQVSTFLDYTDNGSRLVFGEHFADHFFAFKAMPVVIFFSAIVNILYYFGAIQFVLLKIAWMMNFLMGTSPTESVNSGKFIRKIQTFANVFLGPSEAPLLIKPFLSKMTESELFAVMCAAFSTVSGSVLAAYIGFGVSPDHLITAGLMSAPASLAIAKTLFPETKKTHADWEAIRNVKTKKLNNVFEAISTGAIDMIKPIGAILANLIAFVSIFSFLDAVCMWFFGMLNLENFGLASILQYLFWPFAFLMGAESEDCKSIAKLVGFKVFVNEFVAFTKLGAVVNFRNEIIANGTEILYRNGTLPIPTGMPMIWNDRSIVIATYALCGFANFGTIGIEIATLSVFAPTRTKTFLKYAAKAMLAGNFSSFMNACIAGKSFDFSH
ncbi:solute carrier family 28 member 3 [Brachionus plicatilis]|uniref:Solute carrier family 28 member 3 n=1 Tax=Brachionus plicatilis TaxID=10195 RepID=A0A3M7SV18_BRAPC|nr:solute carrier family 28 member 3 [Brachionus plicatilis]